MISREIKRKDIEEKFVGMGDYVKIDYLSRCLKNNLDFDTRKFVLVKLAGLLEERGMFNDAGRNMKSAAEINVSVENKVSDFMKSSELFIRGGDFDMADIAMKKTIQLVPHRQKELENRIKEFYKTHGKNCVLKNRRKQAIDTYEKLLALTQEESEKNEIQKKLLDLYLAVGDMNRYNLLKRRIITQDINN